jgi:hypothetical protein
MVNLKLFAYTVGLEKTVPVILVVVTLLCAAGVVPFIIAQQEEETSLGEEDLAGGIIFDVLDSGDGGEEENCDAAN